MRCGEWQHMDGNGPWDHAHLERDFFFTGGYMFELYHSSPNFYKTQKIAVKTLAPYCRYPKIAGITGCWFPYGSFITNDPSPTWLKSLYALNLAQNYMWGVPKSGYPKWMVYNGQSQKKLWFRGSSWFLHFRKPPYLRWCKTRIR